MRACSAVLLGSTLLLWGGSALRAGTETADAGNSASGLSDSRVLPSIRSRTVSDEWVRPANVLSDAELQRAGAVIGNIKIDTRQIFDTSKSEDNTRLFRLANRLHIKTRETTVATQLLFKSGDLYDPRILEETERLLRGARYLYDAHVRPLAYHDGKVDIEVSTRDVWTLNPGVRFGRSGGKNSSGFELEELNILGTGSRVSLGYKSDVDRKSKSLDIQDKQLFGSWWRGVITYSDNSDGKTKLVLLDHPFYALDVHRAGGISAQDDNRIDSQYDRGKIVNQFDTRERDVTAYYGWSGGLRNGWVRRYSAGVTYDDNQFSRLPGSLLANRVPGNRKLLYPWLAVDLIQDQFERARNRDQIERTEDFFLGWRARAQLGFASSSAGSDRNATIFNGFLGKGYLPSDATRFLWSASATGRYENSELRNGQFSAAARFYTRQSVHRLLYVGLEGIAGSKLDADQQVLLGGDSGLRGYPLRYAGGDSKFLFTIEQRFYTDYYPFRLFNLGGAVFFDAGRVFGNNALSNRPNTLLKDVGFGLRLGSSRSGLGGVIHVDIAFPLDGDTNIKNVQFLVETKRGF